MLYYFLLVCSEYQGILNGEEDACCPSDCGTCGGEECSTLPGGTANCCVGSIRDAGIMCGDEQMAPCLLF